MTKGPVQMLLQSEHVIKGARGIEEVADRAGRVSGKKEGRMRSATRSQAQSSRKIIEKSPQQ
jgi:hypothetical protein